ncbi:MAG: phosphatidylglycerophosphatase A [Betaproteobacteria bacterium]|nr:phosphatidylglycerophosphatase A [Betaproteobacteria bacterium]
MRPTPRFLLSHPAHFIALGFGTGLAPVAPGTVGTLLAFPLYHLIAPGMAPEMFFGVLVVLFALGVWACDRTGRDMGIADHGAMNWDEVVAFMLVLALTPEGIGWQAFAFFAFRVFDVLKPQPIKHFDRTMKGGLGVMFDDVLAAGYTLLLMALVKRFFLQ